MSIEIADYEIISSVREMDPTGASCAILGDCKFYYPPSREAFMQGTGFQNIETFDINGNPTHMLELNNELPEEYHNRYDWVIDSGTLYCCFDIATVFKNIMKMRSSFPRFELKSKWICMQ